MYFYSYIWEFKAFVNKCQWFGGKLKLKIEKCRTCLIENGELKMSDFF